jgi:hypothetical protein
MKKSTTDKNDIDREQYNMYESVRQSGTTNMLDTLMVEKLSMGVLDQDDIRCIISNYDEFEKKFTHKPSDFDGWDRLGQNALETQLEIYTDIVELNLSDEDKVMLNQLLEITREITFREQQ